MHYIIGSTQLIFHRKPPRVGVTSSTKMNSKPPEFEYNKAYTLYNIKKMDEKWCYVFKDATGKLIDKQFESTSQADSWIAEKRGEALPDYNKFYVNNNS